MPLTFFDIAQPCADAPQAKAAIVPIPYERSVSYGKGASRGPEAILRASNQVELYDEVLADEPCRVGICAEDIDEPDQISALTPEKMISHYGPLVGRHLDKGRFPIVLGGEHTVALASFSAAVERFPDLHVLHLDAHADLRDRYEDDLYSHACVARRFAEQAPIVQLGVRSYDREQADFIHQRGVPVLHAHEIRAGADMPAFLADNLGDAVYLSLDLDVFDPSIMPAVGTPEPGGLYWHEIDALLAWLFANRKVVAMDVAELAPIDGQPTADFLAARLVYRAIGRRLLT